MEDKYDDKILDLALSIVFEKYGDDCIQDEKFNTDLGKTYDFITNLISERQTSKVVSLSLTKEEEEDLIRISKDILGSSNKSGLVRFWINKANSERINEMRKYRKDNSITNESGVGIRTPK